jgi:hypothetical protein
MLFAMTIYQKRKRLEFKMESFQENMVEYRNQLEKGMIQNAYQGLMGYMMDLRTYMKNQHPDLIVPASIYYGFMDMTYFSCFPKSLKDRKLKIAIVFLHQAFRFEAWLAGVNKQVQLKYWKLFKESDWNQYRVVPTTKGVDAIVECILVENPDFRDLTALSSQIESGTLKFSGEVERFLSEQ